ncbi:predicted protein [Coccidioides posadasii str. Silveira]|uniref:Predicted protein n=1 Tax=Coccidioides posadasii (strain RMSCC 757 / Silveira) TaxID=443226 RepID=E9CXW1_COCPS|nr:predicted protein [Coccidioides posadasii str. Silveira]
MLIRRRSSSLPSHVSFGRTFRIKVPRVGLEVRRANQVQENVDGVCAGHGQEAGVLNDGSTEVGLGNRFPWADGLYLAYDVELPLSRIGNHRLRGFEGRE